MAWLRTSMGSARGANIEYGKFAQREWALKFHPVTGCVLAEYEEGSSSSSDFPDGNSVSFATAPFPGTRPKVAYSNAHISYSLLNAIGPPLPLAFVADGTEILAAKMEITTTGLTRQRIESLTNTVDCDGNEVTAGYYNFTETVENIAYSFVGLTGPESFEVIGSTPGAANGQRVIDCTQIMQTMLAERATGKFAYGYGVIFIPDDIVGTGSVEDLLSDGPSTILTETGDCWPCGSEHFFGSAVDTQISWGGVSFGQVFLNLQSSAVDNARMCIMPRWPSMKD